MTSQKVARPLISDGVGIGIGVAIDAVCRLILSNLVASSAETAEHRGHPVEFILSLTAFYLVQAPYLFDTDPDFDFDYPNMMKSVRRFNSLY